MMDTVMFFLFNFKHLYLSHTKDVNRVHEIAYGFGGPSEKNVSP